MQVTSQPPSDLYPQVLRDAFTVLDRYQAGIAGRDPTKSLNEDRYELLWRVRRALEPLIFNGGLRRDDVAEIAGRIDELLAVECNAAHGAAPRVFFAR